MPEEMKKNWSLWLAVALPFVMIAFVAASIYLPRLWAPEPQYGFVYTDGQDYNASVTFQVVDGKLIREEVEQEKDTKYREPHLYFYDISTRESRNISFEEAQKLSLDDSKTSPDGFMVKTGGYGGGPFGGSSEPAIYLNGHMTSKKLDLRGIYNVYEFQFIGWVTK